jgi:hypothetical protein
VAQGSHVAYIIVDVRLADRCCPKASSASRNRGSHSVRGPSFRIPPANSLYRPRAKSPALAVRRSDGAGIDSSWRDAAFWGQPLCSIPGFSLRVNTGNCCPNGQAGARFTPTAGSTHSLYGGYRKRKFRGFYLTEFFWFPSESHRANRRGDFARFLNGPIVGNGAVREAVGYQGVGARIGREDAIGVGAS